MLEIHLKSFVEKLDPMRSIDHLGEVAEYMLVLSLNELGRAFLNVDKFVSQNQPYIKARLKKNKIQGVKYMKKIKLNDKLEMETSSR